MKTASYFILLLICLFCLGMSLFVIALRPEHYFNANHYWITIGALFTYTIGIGCCAYELLTQERS